MSRDRAGCTHVRVEPLCSNSPAAAGANSSPWSRPRSSAWSPTRPSPSPPPTAPRHCCPRARPRPRRRPRTPPSRPLPPLTATPEPAGRSAFSDPQWLQVDLGASASVSQVVLTWEAAYAKSFQIQVSDNGSTWTSIYSTTTGAGGVQTLNITGTGRYVRMYGTARGTAYGYSLFEFQVYGALGGGGGCGTSNAALNHPSSASSTENAGRSRVGRVRRQRRHAMVVGLLRPAVGPGGPGRVDEHLPDRADLGGRLRDRFPDPDVGQRHQLDIDLLDDHRRRRHPDAERHRAPADTCA